jgi:hypothetical protein
MRQMQRKLSLIRKLFPSNDLNDVCAAPKTTPQKTRTEELCPNMQQSFPMKSTRQYRPAPLIQVIHFRPTFGTTQQKGSSVSPTYLQTDSRMKTCPTAFFSTRTDHGSTESLEYSQAFFPHTSFAERGGLWIHSHCNAVCSGRLFFCKHVLTVIIKLRR